MEEKTYIEQLDNFSKETGFTYKTNSKVSNHRIVTTERTTKSEYFVFDLNHPNEEMYLVFSDHHSTGAGTSSVYCGVFLKIKECKNEVKIRKRFLLDKVNLKKRYKKGDSYIDEKVTIFAENNEPLPLKITTKTVGKFLSLNKEIPPLEWDAIKESMSFIPVLNGQNWLAVVRDNNWILDTDQLKLLVKNGTQLLMESKMN